MLFRTTFVFERPSQDVMVCSQDYFGSDTEEFPTSGQNTVEHVTLWTEQFWTNMRSFYPTAVTLREVRYYREDDNVLPWGDVYVVNPVGTAGTAAAANDGPLPYQVACSVTKEGIFRRRWGRAYMPGPTKDEVTSAGRYTAEFVQAMAINWAAMIDGIQDGTIWQAVILPAVLGGDVPLPNSNEVRAIRVDDVPDVMRSRRLDNFVTRHRVEIPDVSP